MDIAVLKTGGKQYLVKKGDVLKVEKLDVEEGSSVEFHEVLMTADQVGTNVCVGTPLLEHVTVKGKAQRHDRYDKVITGKFKPKKRYHVRRGHRQWFTEVVIDDIAST